MPNDDEREDEAGAQLAQQDEDRRHEAMTLADVERTRRSMIDHAMDPPPPFSPTEHVEMDRIRVLQHLLDTHPTGRIVITRYSPQPVYVGDKIQYRVELDVQNGCASTNDDLARAIDKLHELSQR